MSIKKTIFKIEKTLKAVKKTRLKLKGVIKKAKANGKGTKKYLKKYKILSEISKVLDSLKEHYLNLTLVIRN